MLLNTISFNLGIEPGLISALAVISVVVIVWKKSRLFNAQSRIPNYSLIVAGLLFLPQTYGCANNSESENVQKYQWRDSISITIHPNSDREYSFYLKKGGTLEYSWRTNSKKLLVDFHGEPKGAAVGYFESFKKSISSQSNGSFISPFEGTVGWYWVNTGQKPVEIILQTKGSYGKHG